MKKLFENWRKHITEAAVPHSANHVVNKMRSTNPPMTAMAALKSLTTDLSDEEAKNWLRRNKDKMAAAEENKQDLASRE